MKKFLTTKWGFFILIVLVIITFFIFTKFNFFSSFEGMVSYGFSPIQSFFNESATRVQNFFKYFDDIEKIKDENELLKNRIAELTSSNLKLSNDFENSGIILNEYEYINDYKYNAVLGKVISRGSDNYLQSVIINKGIKDGIQIGYPATTESGYIIGKVIESNSYSSKILLLNDIHSKISASISNEQHSSGIVSGAFGLSLKLDLIPYDHEISVDDLVVTSGLEKNIPADLIIGKILSISKNEGELFQSADLDQITNYENLKILTIILPAND